MIKKNVILVSVIAMLLMVGCSDSKDTNIESSSDTNVDKTTSTQKESKVTDGSYNGELTINFEFGERIGQYKGELKGGLPNGYGEFTTDNSEGSKWTYKGEWKDGHFNGEGQTEWDNGTKQIGIYLNDQITPMSEIETKKMIAQPQNYENHFVELKGLIFTQPEYFDEGVAIQMYTDIENYDSNVIVYIYDTDILLNVDEMINVTGLVGEVFKGTNAFGAELILPTVHASNYEIITYEKLHPIISSKEVNQTQVQLGYSITVQKVEITDIETRVYIKIDNEGNNNFNLYSFNAKIIQNGKQFEEQSNWDANYPEIQTDLFPGVSTEGIIAYPPIQAESFKLILEGSSDDWSEDISDFIFNIDF